MNWMDQVADFSHESTPKRHTQHLGGYQLERSHERFERHFRNNVFVPNHDYNSLFRPVVIEKLHRVGQGTDVTCVRMKQILGPMLSFLRVVAERSRDLQFDRPMVGNQYVWKASGSCVHPHIGLMSFQVVDQCTAQPCFAVRTDARLILAKGRL